MQTTSPDSTPFFTICTVCYNAADVITPCIDSIRALHPAASFEYLVIDGASTDTTLKVVKAATADFDASVPVRIVSEPDGGIYDAMNKGIAHAHGRYIIFMNADDTIAPTALSDATHLLADKDPNFACLAGAIQIKTPSGRTYVRKPNPATLTETVPLTMITGHQSMFVSVELARRVGGFSTKYKIAGDYDFFLHTLKAKASWFTSDEIYSEFVLGGASYSLIETARDYRRVRIAHGINPLLGWALYAKNVGASLVERVLLRTKSR